jgi:hypothetical protein
MSSTMHYTALLKTNYTYVRMIDQHILEILSMCVGPCRSGTTVLITLTDNIVMHKWVYSA